MIQIFLLSVLRTSHLPSPYLKCTGKSASLSRPQCNAMQDLWHSTGGNTTWQYCNTTTSLTDPCGCIGRNLQVICSGADVIELGLYGMGMTGSLPTSLSALTGLTCIQVNCNYLSGSLPDLPYAAMASSDACDVGGPGWYIGETCSSRNLGPHTSGNKWGCGEYNKSTSFAFANTKAGCYASCTPAPSP